MNINTGSEHWWLSKQGRGTKVSSHEDSIKQLILKHNLKIDIDDGYEYMFSSGFARIIINTNGVFAQTSFENLHVIKITREQKNWLEDKSFEKGFDGDIKNLRGEIINTRIQFREFFEL
jgi:hypothetical protein